MYINEYANIVRSIAGDTAADRFLEEIYELERYNCFSEGMHAFVKDYGKEIAAKLESVSPSGIITWKELYEVMHDDFRYVRIVSGYRRTYTRFFRIYKDKTIDNSRPFKEDDYSLYTCILRRMADAMLIKEIEGMRKVYYEKGTRKIKHIGIAYRIL